MDSIFCSVSWAVELHDLTLRNIEGLEILLAQTPLQPVEALRLASRGQHLALPMGVSTDYRHHFRSLVRLGKNSFSLESPWPKPAWFLKACASIT